MECFIKTIIIYNPYSGKCNVSKELDNIYRMLNGIEIVDISIFYPNRCKEITDYIQSELSKIDENYYLVLTIDN